MGQRGPAHAAADGSNPLQPVDTSSPRATLEGFREYTEKAYNAWHLREVGSAALSQARNALHTIDLSHVGKALIEEVGVADALYLYETLSRIDLPPPEAIPDAEAVKSQGIKRWTIPGTEIMIAQMSDGDRAGEFLFTAETLARAPEFYALVQGLPVLNGPENVIETWRDAPGLPMPDWITARIWALPPWAFYILAKQPLWKWLAVGLALLGGVVVAWLGWRSGRRLDKYCRRIGADWRVGDLLAVSLTFVALVGIAYFIEAMVQFRERPGIIVAVTLDAVNFVLLAWLAALVVSGIGNIVAGRFSSGKGSLDAALIRLCFRILSIGCALVVMLRAADNFGLSITPIIAGLGVGGLAVALAIRPTLENIVGGFVLFADKPVRVGEFCAFGSMMGTVEAIGLRSTRIRALDRTLITVPNAEFSQLQIVNFTRRDMNLFQCSIGLRYETTPDQLRFVAAKIRKLLIQHSKVLPDPARVRFSEFGASAYILDIFALVQSADWNQFLAVKEDLNLRIIDIVAESGTGFAFPSQTVYFSRDSGLNMERGKVSTAEVQRWRDEKRMPFPDFDFAERAEMSGTIPFPSESSPDYRPPAKQPDPRTASAPPPGGRAGLAALFRQRTSKASGNGAKA